MEEKKHRTAQYSRRSAEQWQSIMQAYESSGLTQESFCARESLSPSTFYSWRQRLGENSTKPEESMFIELASPQMSAKPGDWDIELSLGNNIVLRLRQAH